VGPTSTSTPEDDGWREGEKLEQEASGWGYLHTYSEASPLCPLPSFEILIILSDV
jgi:hypothetical protein